MATDVYYNGVQLHNVTTREWEQEVVYDESGTDMLANRYRLRFECIIAVPGNTGSEYQAPTWTALHGGSWPQTTTTGTYESLRWLLTQPRKELLVKMGSETVLQVLPSTVANVTSTKADTNNGPKPQVVSITHVASNTVFRIVWSVECEVRQCPSAIVSPSDPEPPVQANLSNVLNNRWSIAESMNERCFITRTIRGRIRLASSNLLVGHTYKALVVPKLESGFKRESIDYEVQPNGLEATYQIVDRQVHTAAPSPAVEMEANYQEIGTDNGSIWKSQINVRLSGTPNASKRLLIARAFQVAEARLQISGGTTVDPDAPGEIENNSYMVEEAVITESIGEDNSVELMMRIQRFGDTSQYMKGLVTEKYGKPLSLEALDGVEYNPVESLNPQYFGYNPQAGVRDPAAVLAPLHCMLQQPCMPDGAHAIDSTTAPTISAKQVDPERTPRMDAEDDNTTLTPDGYDYYHDSAQANVYTVSRMESKYVKNGLNVQLPIATSTTLGNTSVVIALAQPTAIREIRVEAERVGKWPLIPMPSDTYQDGSLTGTLLDHWVKPQPPTLDALGQKKIYRVTAYYSYALNRPPTTAESVNVGVLPFTNFEMSDTKFTPETAYSQRLLA